MSVDIKKTSATKDVFTVVLVRTAEDASHVLLAPLKNIILQKLGDSNNGLIFTYEGDAILAAVILNEPGKKTPGEIGEEARVKGGHLAKKINHEKCSSVLLMRASDAVSKDELLACTEGMALNCYQFLKYKSDKKENTLKTIQIQDDAVSDEEVNELRNIVRATEISKDLCNEPVVSLNSVQLGEKATEYGNTFHFKTEVLQKSQIEALRMGGLLGVNMGSSVPPTFSILEYKPAIAKNKKPLILIGKGVTYDTGGYSLKPSNAMSGMKMDMTGAAAVIGAFCAIAENAIPVYCIGLIPSTDNKVDSDALTPDDVIVMHDGTTVEVLNTDAEGRLILADALSYAKKYDPELVIDLATLTGSAAAITGTLGSAMMGTDTTYRNLLIECGNLTYERLWEIPYWKEYADMLKSDVADLKNIGGPIGGSATAGKFLEHFTNYPWLHLDIAGPAILKEEEPYKQRGSSGVGVRLLYAFAKKFAEKNN